MTSRDHTLTLTPTARLARALVRQHALAASSAGERAWLSPSVLSLPAWFSRLREDYFLHNHDRRLLIDTTQARLVWQGLIDYDIFVGEPQVTSLVQQSWRQLHEHRLPLPEQWDEVQLSYDNRQFAAWAARYLRRGEESDWLDEWQFAAELPSHIAAGRIPLPSRLQLAGFDLPTTPLTYEIFSAVSERGVEVVGLDNLLDEQADDLADVQQAASATTARSATPVQLSHIYRCANPDDELAAAAEWARHTLATRPDQHLAIVVPALAGRLEAVERALGLAFDAPGFGLRVNPSQPWHISLGRPLAQWPIVEDALAWLQQAPQQFDQPRLAAILRSPFLADFDTEARHRAKTLLELSAKAPYQITTWELLRDLRQSGPQQLAELVERWQQVRAESPARARPAEWLAYFQAELGAIGFARGRSLGSHEYQALARWHDLLDSFGALDTLNLQPMGRQEALGHLQQLTAQTIFREQNPGVPLEVLGVEEAIGSAFEAIWLTGLDDETWPPPARRDPLLPSYLQRQLPRATPNSAHNMAHAELAALARCASTVVGSYAQQVDDVDRRRTSLVSGEELPAQLIDDEVAAPLQQVPDASGPPLLSHASGGGVGVLREQINCPFRAFARYRLGVREETAVRPGLDALTRGSAAHDALNRFWPAGTTQREIANLAEDELQARITNAVQQSLDKLSNEYWLRLGDAERALEQERLQKMLADWLALELEREEFTVLAAEERRSMEIGGLTLNGQIDRLDRTADGSQVVIDYKTGATNRNAWLPDQDVHEPQLPAYAVAMAPRPDAIAFAGLKAGAMGYTGVADGDMGIPGVTPVADAAHGYKEIESWDELLAAWQARLTAVAQDYQQGQAQVEPRAPVVCRHCSLQGLCRIGEQDRFAGPDAVRGAGDGSVDMGMGAGMGMGELDEH